VEQASQVLWDFGDKAKVYTDGAEFVAAVAPWLVAKLDFDRSQENRKAAQINLQTDKLRIAARVTHQARPNSELLREQAPSLAYAESQVANVRVRNQSTSGGNLASTILTPIPGPFCSSTMRQLFWAAKKASDSRV
jgi:CO/xanthine dehydrogenase FAD-binding subunit